jgi:hypothetical protein
MSNKYPASRTNSMERRKKNPPWIVANARSSFNRLGSQVHGMTKTPQFNKRLSVKKDVDKAFGEEPELDHEIQEDGLDDLSAQFRSFCKPTQRVKRSQRKRKKFAGSVVDHDQELISQAKRLLVDSRTQSRQSQMDASVDQPGSAKTAQHDEESPDMTAAQLETESFGSPPPKAKETSPGSPEAHT